MSLSLFSFSERKSTLNLEEFEKATGRFMDALNYFGAIISPEALAKMRESQSDQELRKSLEEAIQACLTFLTTATSLPDGMDPARVKELLAPVLVTPELVDFQRPAPLAERLRAALEAMGIPTEAGSPDSGGSG